VNIRHCLCHQSTVYNVTSSSVECDIEIGYISNNDANMSKRLLYCTRTVLYCTVHELYSTVLYCTVLYCTVHVLYCTVHELYSTVLYCMWAVKHWYFVMTS